MFSRKNLFGLPAVLAIGIFALTQTSLADETATTRTSVEGADRAAEIARSVTANGDRRASDEPLTIAQVSTEPAPESTPSDEAEASRVVVTGTNIASDSPPFVPETIFNRQAVERTGSRSLGDFFQIASSE